MNQDRGREEKDTRIRDKIIFSFFAELSILKLNIPNTSIVCLFLSAYGIRLFSLYNVFH